MIFFLDHLPEADHGAADHPIQEHGQSRSAGPVHGGGGNVPAEQGPSEHVGAGERALSGERRGKNDRIKFLCFRSLEFDIDFFVYIMD